VNNVLKVIAGKWSKHEIERPVLHRVDIEPWIERPCHHNDLRGDLHLAPDCQQLSPRAVWKDRVRENDIRRAVRGCKQASHLLTGVRPTSLDVEPWLRRGCGFCRS